MTKEEMQLRLSVYTFIHMRRAYIYIESKIESEEGRAKHHSQLI